MQNTDSLGTWQFIGLIAVPPNEWSFFPADVVNSETIRFTFTTDWAKRKYPYASYGLVRLVYQTADLTVGPTSRIYPSPEKQIREYRVPDDLKANGIVTRALSIKRILKSRYKDLVDLDPSWAVEAEYLVTS